MQHDNLFRLGYLCGWAQGWGWATSPWVTEQSKKLIFFRHTEQLLKALDGLEHSEELDALFEQWEAMFLEECEIDVRFGGKEAEDRDSL